MKNALTKITIPLQVLEKHTTLSAEQRRLVNVSRQGLVELDAILRDDIKLDQLTELPAAPDTDEHYGLA